MPADDLEGLVEEHIQEAEMKKRVEEDFHVKVYPDVWLTDSSANIKRTCEKIREAVRRHVDDVNYAVVARTTKDICEFCESVWEESECGLPLCCDAAVNEWESENLTVEMDGNQFFVKDKNFTNLQESIHYGFGDTKDDAIDAYYRTFSDY